MSKGQEELKPCPFCGGEARLDQRVTQSLWNSSDAVFSHVACDECDISGQDFCDDPDGEEAIEWWNRRAQQAPADQEPVACPYCGEPSSANCDQSYPHPTAEPAPAEQNQCDGCRAGLPVDDFGMHRMGTSLGYSDPMMCQAGKYTAPIAAEPAPVQDEQAIYECAGCGTVTRDAAAQMALYKRAGAISCCPERNMVPLARPARAAPQAPTEQAECKCSMSIKVLGDGCSVCNPDYLAEILAEQAAAPQAPAEQAVQSGLVDAVAEAVKYLDSSELNAIGSGSILHREMRQALADYHAALAKHGEASHD
ncbi:MAG: hypothetical protein CMJ75_19055 [Planctomycetaceae bacterium]|nr:hypothetical protein [Planctomycetaceae bacterium]